MKTLDIFNSCFKLIQYIHNYTISSCTAVFARQHRMELNKLSFHATVPMDTSAPPPYKNLYKIEI